MFTGIVEDQGIVVDLQHPEGDQDAVLTLRSAVVSADASLGASIAVNGVCLTVTAMDGDQLRFDVMPQTLSLTNLGDVRPGAAVNLERALRADGRLDGHIVQGHVDGVAVLRRVEPGPRWSTMEFSLPRDLARFVAPQGSIAVDGVSLTVTHVTEETFGVSLIPTTLDVTILGGIEVGHRANIEVDVLAKYVDRLSRFAP